MAFLHTTKSSDSLLDGTRALVCGHEQKRAGMQLASMEFPSNIRDRCLVRVLSLLNAHQTFFVHNHHFLMPKPLHRATIASIVKIMLLIWPDVIPSTKPIMASHEHEKRVHCFSLCASHQQKRLLCLEGREVPLHLQESICVLHQQT